MLLTSERFDKVKRFFEDRLYTLRHIHSDDHVITVQTPCATLAWYQPKSRSGENKKKMEKSI